MVMAVRENLGAAEVVALGEWVGKQVGVDVEATAAGKQEHSQGIGRQEEQSGDIGQSAELVGYF